MIWGTWISKIRFTALEDLLVDLGRELQDVLLHDLGRVDRNDLLHLALEDRLLDLGRELQDDLQTVNWPGLSGNTVSWSRLRYNIRNAVSRP